MHSNDTAEANRQLAFWGPAIFFGALILVWPFSLISALQILDQPSDGIIDYAFGRLMAFTFTAYPLVFFFATYLSRRAYTQNEPASRIFFLGLLSMLSAHSVYCVFALVAIPLGWI